MHNRIECFLHIQKLQKQYMNYTLMQMHAEKCHTHMYSHNFKYVQDKVMFSVDCFAGHNDDQWKTSNALQKFGL